MASRGFHVDAIKLRLWVFPKPHVTVLDVAEHGEVLNLHELAVRVLLAGVVDIPRYVLHVLDDVHEHEHAHHALEARGADVEQGDAVLARCRVEQYHLVRALRYLIRYCYRLF